MDTYYCYDTSNGRLLASKSGNVGYCYTYDAMGKLTGVTPASRVTQISYSPTTNAESVSYTYNQNNLISSITTNTSTYSFTYDVFGNASSVSVGDNTLAIYTYGENNGKLKKVTYGNGFTVEYVYNDIELLAEVWYIYSDESKNLVYKYEYTADGQVYKLTDCINKRCTVYRYDVNNRFIGHSYYDESDMSFDFSSAVYHNDQGLVNGAQYSVNHWNGNTRKASTVNYSFSYLTDGRISQANINTKITRGTETYTYDIFDRVTSKTNSFSPTASSSTGFNNTVSYSYDTYNNCTRSYVAEYSSTINGATTQSYVINYHSDVISSIQYSTGERIIYTYDHIGQLIREDNQLTGRSYLYSYDVAGNKISCYVYAYSPDILSTRIAIFEYLYTDSEWGDLYTSFWEEFDITYDTLGNPLSYYNGISTYSFGWTGRSLMSATSRNVNYKFTYNDEGIRTSKTVGGTKTNYLLDGSRIIAEETNGNITIYVYDSQGSPIGFQYHAATYSEDVWDVYWYEKNMHGDIVAVYNSTGTKLIGYAYNAWGVCTTTEYNGGFSTPAYNNPYRYRGYYYDIGLDLYYLNSRYYDANTGRYLNADKALYHDMLGYNMFAYCNNDPVNYYDPTGEFAISITVASLYAIGVALLKATAVTAVVTAAIITAIEIGEAIGESNAKEVDTPPHSITQSINDSTDDIASSEISAKDEYDPNPYRRPGEKKQNRENRAKSRTKPGWEPRNNRRDGKPSKIPKHTPSKKGHKKYFSLIEPIKIF